MRFYDRKEAGRLLAERLSRYAGGGAGGAPARPEASRRRSAGRRRPNLRRVPRRRRRGRVRVHAGALLCGGALVRELPADERRGGAPTAPRGDRRMNMLSGAGDPPTGTVGAPATAVRITVGAVDVDGDLGASTRRGRGIDCGSRAAAGWSRRRVARRPTDLAGGAARAGRGADAADRRRPRHHRCGAERAGAGPLGGCSNTSRLASSRKRRRGRRNSEREEGSRDGEERARGNDGGRAHGEPVTVARGGGRGDEGGGHRVGVGGGGKPRGGGAQP